MVMHECQMPIDEEATTPIGGASHWGWRHGLAAAWWGGALRLVKHELVFSFSFDWPEQAMGCFV